MFCVDSSKDAGGPSVTLAIDLSVKANLRWIEGSRCEEELMQVLFFLLVSLFELVLQERSTVLVCTPVTGYTEFSEWFTVRC